MRITCVRRPRHQYPNESNRRRIVRKPDSFGSTIPRCNLAMRECLPYAFRLSLNGIVSRPVLHNITSRIRLRPRDANAVHLLILRQIKNHPLRMQRVTLTSESLSEIWIALPISIQITVRQPGETGVVGSIIARGSAMRQRVAIGITNRLGRRGRPREVSLAGGIAPSSLRIPVPRLDCELSILTVGHWLPTRSEHLLQHRLQQILVDGCRWNTIHSRAQRFIRYEAIGDVRGSDVHLNRLCSTNSQKKKTLDQGHSDQHPIPQDQLLKTF